MVLSGLIWYNNEESADGACGNRHLTSISIETVVEMVSAEEKKMSCCDTCIYYVYDEDYECYTCMVDLDEDDMSRFLAGGSFECSFYSLDDEYQIVRKQM